MIIFAEYAKANKPKKKTLPSGSVTFSESTKIDGQRVVIVANHHPRADAKDVWTVTLLIGADRAAKKQMRLKADFPSKYENKGTGGIGLKGLYWARRQLDLFQWKDPKAIVVIVPSDERRFNIYARTLTKIGFIVGEYGGEKALFRTPEQFKKHLTPYWRQLHDQRSRDRG
jgi:hypothetical protein